MIEPTNSIRTRWPETDAVLSSRKCIMGKYLARRIIDEKFTYQEVIEKYPLLKSEVDEYLEGKGKEELIK